MTMLEKCCKHLCLIQCKMTNWNGIMKRTGCIHYSVRSAYWCCVGEVIDVEHNRVPSRWNLIWNAKPPPKVKHLLWRVCRNCLSTRVRLLDRRLDGQSNCVLSDSGVEDNMHLFFISQNSVQCWQRIGIWQWLVQVLNSTKSVAENILDNLQLLNSNQNVLFACTLWSIWKQRNYMIWRNEIVQRNAVWEYVC